MQHYSTAQGTVGSVQGSQGGKAVGASTAYGNTAAGKTSSGDRYAGHDGNVYKNIGDGWQKYDNSSGSWNTVNTPENKQQAQQKAQQQKQSYQQENPNSRANAQQAQQQRQTTQQDRPSTPQPSSTTTQQRPQNTNATRSSNTAPTLNLNSEMQNRKRGAAQTDNYQRSSPANASRTRSATAGGGARRR